MESVETIKSGACAHFSWALKGEEILIYFCKSSSPLLFLGWEGGFSAGWRSEQTHRVGKGPENGVRHLPPAKSGENRGRPWVAASRWPVRTWNKEFQSSGLAQRISCIPHLDVTSEKVSLPLLPRSAYRKQRGSALDYFEFHKQGDLTAPCYYFCDFRNSFDLAFSCVCFFFFFSIWRNIGDRSNR